MNSLLAGWAILCISISDFIPANNALFCFHVRAFSFFRMCETRCFEMFNARPMASIVIFCLRIFRIWRSLCLACRLIATLSIRLIVSAQYTVNYFLSTLLTLACGSVYYALTNQKGTES